MSAIDIWLSVVSELVAALRNDTSLRRVGEHVAREDLADHRGDELLLVPDAVDVRAVADVVAGPGEGEGGRTVEDLVARRCR